MTRADFAGRIDTCVCIAPRSRLAKKRLPSATSRTGRKSPPGSRAAPGLDQFRRVDVEDGVDRPSDQRRAILRIQQLHRGLIGRHDRGIRRERDGPVVLQVHEFRPGVEAEHDAILEVPQEQILFDQARGQVDQRHGVRDPGAHGLRAQRGGVENRHQRTCRIPNGRAGTGQADVAGTKVFAQVHGHRLVLGDAGADAIGSLATLAPIRAADQPGLPEGVRQRRVFLLVQDDATRIGEDQRVTGLGDVVVQPVDLRRSDLHQVRGLFAAPRQRSSIEHARRVVTCRVDGIVERAATPRDRDRGVQVGNLSLQPPRPAADELEHVRRMLHDTGIHLELPALMDGPSP